jgi:hypothetical protein
MAFNLLASWKARRAARERERHPVYGPVLRHAQAVLSDRSRGIGKMWTEAGKEKLQSSLLSDMALALAAPNPAQAVRMRTIEFMLQAAQFDVLVMQPPTPFKGLSGDLQSRIPELAKCDKELETFFHGMDPTPTEFDDMRGAVLARYWVMQLYMNSYDQARIALGDWHPDRRKDWFRPCYTSLCIWQEGLYRGQLGLAPAIEGEMQDMKAIMHGTWVKLADEGRKELRLDWERTWRDTFDEPSPYDDLEM